ncbi:hypothetical protein IAQ61_003914 [Plenodomus lingam]|uniref:uncharacterized protein n=1 Tax=Leptosphaeria maculans TaxID=5022 RepID=UPI00332D23B6|nr:hypothetical protein IAQ61_003914 [Plenodomus lingam]
MTSQYKLVASADHHTLTPVTVHDSRSRYSRTCWAALLAVVSLTNICVLFFSIHLWRAARTMAMETPDSGVATLNVTAASVGTDDRPAGVARAENLPTAYVPFHWKTPWGAPNATWADTLWDNINTAHGHIAVDHEWAAANNVSKVLSCTHRNDLKTDD